MSLFGWTDAQKKDWSLQQKVDAQLEVPGVSLAAVPLELVADKLKGTGAISTLDAITKTGQRVIVTGV